MAIDQNQLQRFLLVALRAAGEIGISEETLLRDARAEGFAELLMPSLATTLRGMADRSWVHPYQPPLAAKRWKISAQGLSMLEHELHI